MSEFLLLFKVSCDQVGTVIISVINAEEQAERQWDTCKNHGDVVLGPPLSAFHIQSQGYIQWSLLQSFQRDS